MTTFASGAPSRPSFREWVGDNKFVALDLKDLDSHLTAGAEAAFAEYISRSGRPPSEITVLDFGCGRGSLVGKLRRKGWRAFGVEIEQRFVDAGAAVSQMASEPYPILSTLSADGRTVFPDGFFDMVLTEQVLEHVRDLEQLVGEMDRITAPGGILAHSFPAQYRILEPHYKLPFVHWLPKNNLRYAATRALVAIGIGVRGKSPLSSMQKAQTIFEYSVSETFYRPLAAIEQAFRKRGFTTDSDILIQRRLNNRLARGNGLLNTILATIVKRHLLFGIFCATYKRFRSVMLLCRKSA